MELSFDELTNLGSKIATGFKRLQFGTKAQLAFLEDFYVLINDGIPANRAIEMMSRVSTGLNREVALSISEKIAQGQPLAEGMGDWFSPNVVEIVRVGEAGGALPQTLKSSINMLSQRGVAFGSFVGAIAYPLFVIFIACGVILYLKTSVFSQFILIKPVSEWPPAGQRLMAVADLISKWWWTVLISIIVFVLVIRKIMSSYTGVLRPIIDKIPPFTFYRQLVSARLLETLGLLVANGVVFKAAIKVMQFQANPYAMSHLVQMEHLLSMGKTNIADVLDTGLVDPKDLMRLRVMAEVKGFEHGLIRMGVRGTEQATAAMKLLSRVFGGILMTISALLIIMIIQGIYLTGMAMGG